MLDRCPSIEIGGDGNLAPCVNVFAERCQLAIGHGMGGRPQGQMQWWVLVIDRFQDPGNCLGRIPRLFAVVARAIHAALACSLTIVADLAPGHGDRTTEERSPKRAGFDDDNAQPERGDLLVQRLRQAFDRKLAGVVIAFINTGLWTLWITLAVVAVAIPAFVALMRKSSRGHLLLFEIVAVGIPGVAGLVFGATCWANRHEETMPAVQHIVQIQDRYITTSRRNRKNHHLVVGWPDPRVDKEFGVSEEFYHQYDTTRCAQVTWHYGYFNDPFLSGMQPTPCEAPLAVE